MKTNMIAKCKMNNEVSALRHKWLLKFFYYQILVGLLLVAGMTFNPAQSQATDFKSVQGSWIGTLTAPDNRTSLGLATFTPNGGLVTTNQGDTLLSRPQGSGHGAWVQDGQNVSTRIAKFVGDDKGVLVSIVEEKTSGALDVTGNFFTATASYTVYYLNGDPPSTGTGTITAQRITMTTP